MPELCERVTVETTCTYHHCMTTVDNHAYGSKDVMRYCGDYAEIATRSGTTMPPRSAMQRPRNHSRNHDTDLGNAVQMSAWAWLSKPPTVTGHPPTLQKLAQSVEQYRLLHNGSLP